MASYKTPSVIKITIIRIISQNKSTQKTMNKKDQLSQIKINSFLTTIAPAHVASYKQLRTTIIRHLPDGYSEQIDNNNLAYVVPHSIFPDGYHCNPETPLPFMSIASQKNFIALHHMGLYSNEKLLSWFVKQYPQHCKYKLDMGKSCVRFKKVEFIPYDLIAQLVQKMTANDWIKQYQHAIKKMI